MAIYFLQVVIYYINQSRFIFGGDSGEYLIVSNTWSIPHAPGYPLYSFASNILRYALFFLPDYFRINILSIVPAVLTSYLLYKIIVHFIKHKYIALLSSTLYAFLFPVWLYAEIPEVFSLNNFFLALITYLILLFKKSSKSIYKYIIYLLLGLSFAHHHTFILFIPGWYLLLSDKRSVFFKTNVFKNLAFLIFGLLFYLYIPIASSFNPPIDWENGKTLEGFIRLVTRSSYGTFKAYSSSSPNLINQLFDAFSSIIFIIKDFRIIGILFIVLGLTYVRKINRSFAKFLYISIFFQLLFLFYTNFPLASSFAVAMIERFLIALYLLLIIAFAFGVQFSFLKLKVFSKKYLSNIQLKKTVIFSYFLFLILYLCVIIYSNARYMAQIPNLNYFEIYAKDILNTVPKNSILSMKSDTGFFTTSYMYYVEKYRNDIILIFVNTLDRKYYRERVKKKYPKVIIPIDKENNTFDLNEFLSKNSKNYNIFFEQLNEKGIWIPYGLLWKYYDDKKTLQKNKSDLIKTNEDLWTKIYKFPINLPNDSKFLHILCLKSKYVQMLEIYAQLLIANNQNSQALKYLHLISDKLDPSYTASLKSILDIYVKNKKCNNANKYAEMLKKHTRYSNINEIGSILKFHYYCDKNSEDVEKYLEIYNNIRNKQKTPLNKI